LPSILDVTDFVTALEKCMLCRGYSLSLGLTPADNKPTLYRLSATFDGDQRLNATAYASLPDGTNCAVCTTVKYGFKPVLSSTVLRVSPPSTEVTQPTKTPEQMQQQAEDEGWLNLQTWHEFTWWPPWYRLHINATIGGKAWIHAAFNPVIPIIGGEIATHGLENLLPPLPSTPMPPSLPPPPNINVSDELTTLILREMFALTGFMAVAVAGGNLPVLPAAIVAVAIYGFGASMLIYDAYRTYYSSEWGAHTKAFSKLMSLMATLIGATIGVELSFSAALVIKTVVIPIVSTFVSALINSAALTSALQSAYISMWTALFAGLALLKIPNPSGSNAYFKPAFIVANVVLIGVIFGFVVGLPA